MSKWMDRLQTALRWVGGALLLTSVLAMMAMWTWSEDAIEPCPSYCRHVCLMEKQ
jgi:hypothetical protein